MRSYNILRVSGLSVLVSLFQGTALLAQQAPAAPAGKPDAMSPIIPLLLMVAVFFFFIIWPQSKKAKKQAAFLSSLQRGDAVVTSSGLYGKIHGIADRVITLEIAPNVRIRVDRQSIAAKDLTPGESSKADKNNGEAA